MILANIWQLDFKLLWAQSAVTVIFSTGLTLFLFFAGKHYFRRAAFRSPALWSFMFGIGNVAYIGIPMLQMFFGESAVTLAIVYSSVGDVFIWLLHYPAVLKGEKRPLREVLLNPCLIALILGLILSEAKIPVPEILAPGLNASAKVVPVTALFYVGTVFAGAKLREIPRDMLAWNFSAIKVVVLPAVCFLILWPIIGASQAVILAMIAACPTPLLSLVWARDDPADEMDTQRCFFISTLLYLAVMLTLCMIVSGALL